MGLFQTLKDKLLGTEEQNKAASERMAKEDEKAPDTVQAKVNRAVEKVKPEAPAKKMAKGGAVRSSASKRADGIATKGKTRGKIV